MLVAPCRARDHDALGPGHRRWRACDEKGWRRSIIYPQSTLRGQTARQSDTHRAARKSIPAQKINNRSLKRLIVECNMQAQLRRPVAQAAQMFDEPDRPFADTQQGLENAVRQREAAIGNRQTCILLIEKRAIEPHLRHDTCSSIWAGARSESRYRLSSKRPNAVTTSALIDACAFKSISTYSACGVDAATTPPPTPMVKCPFCATMVRMTMDRSAAPSSPIHPSAPE